MVAQAATGETRWGTETRMPFHGYYFKILTAQGPAGARGGAKDYVVKGELSGGFRTRGMARRVQIQRAL